MSNGKMLLIPWWLGKPLRAHQPAIQAKYAIWDLVDAGIFDGLTRDGQPITKTFGGDKQALMKACKCLLPTAEIQARRQNQ
jgi:hypothetical protein